MPVEADCAVRAAEMMAELLSFSVELTQAWARAAHICARHDVIAARHAFQGTACYGRRHNCWQSQTGDLRSIGAPLEPHPAVFTPTPAPPRL